MKKLTILLLSIFIICSACDKKTGLNINVNSQNDLNQIATDNNNDDDNNLESQNIPELAKEHFKQANISLSQGDYENAIFKFQLAIKQKPDFSKAYYNMGVAYFENNKIESAISAWNKTISIDPNYTKAYLSLGFAYEKLSNKDKAIENYDKYLQMNPDNLNAKKISDKISALRGQVRGEGIIGSIVLAEKVDSNTYQAIEPVDIFQDNIPAIFATVEVGDAIPNTVIKVEWYYLGLKGDEIKVNEQEKIISGPQNMVLELTKPKPNKWPTGRYELRLFVNGKENLSLPFTILKGEQLQNAKGQNS